MAFSPQGSIPGLGSVISGMIASGQVGPSHIAANSILAPHMTNQAVLSAALGSGQIGLGHLQGGSTSGQVITAQGVLAPTYAGVPPPTIGPGTILSSQIASGQIGQSHIQMGAVGSPQLANQGLLSANIAANVIATPHIRNQGLLSASFGALTIGTPHIANQSIISGHLASGVLMHPFWIASDNVIINSNALVEFQNINPQKVKEGSVGQGTFRVKFELETVSDGFSAEGRVYRNAVALSGQLTSSSISSGQFTAFNKDIPGWNAGDLCQIYANGTGGTPNCGVKNFSVCGAAVSFFRITAGY